MNYIDIGDIALPDIQRPFVWKNSKVRDRMGGQYHTYLDIHFSEYEEQRILAIGCNKSSSPVYVKDGQEERFYIRTGPSTSELTGYEMQTYIGRRFS